MIRKRERREKEKVRTLNILEKGKRQSNIICIKGSVMAPWCFISALKARFT